MAFKTSTFSDKVKRSCYCYSINELAESNAILTLVSGSAVLSEKVVLLATLLYYERRSIVVICTLKMEAICISETIVTASKLQGVIMQKIRISISAAVKSQNSYY